MDALRLILWGIFGMSVNSAFDKAQNVDIYSFHINSTVTSRYATTTITSRVANKLNESQEILFEVKIPKNAFISKFRMMIEGKSYDGVVKEKAEAQQQYSQAVSRGQSAGLIKSVGRTLEDFKTSVTVAALSKVTFELTYEELLKRRLGKYELLINAQPMQTVTDFKIDVHIHDKSVISFLEVKGDLSTNDLANAIKTTIADTDAWVTFYPTRDQQTSKTCDENGLNGDLLITYDVERQNPNGEITVSNGYFVHYFAPSDIPQIPKNVVFIIDRSGSMHGKKMEQTRLALLRILSDLFEDDHFGLITFDSQIQFWKRELLKATKANLEDAKAFVKRITDSGTTDINAAVLSGVNMMRQHSREETVSILILLTDGDPTAGETDTEKIMANVKEAIGSKFLLFCLGFGYDVNFAFLTKMSLENNGVARRIYENSDADVQLQGFYDEVDIPLLTDIQLNYIGLSDLTKTSFNIYFSGSEIVVSGRITDDSVENVTTEISAKSKGCNVTYHDNVMANDVQPEHRDFIERLWAYLTVKQLLDRQVLLQDPEKEDEKKEALNLSLKYQFVTPLTAMVVTKPQGEAEVADKPTERGDQPRPTDLQTAPGLMISPVPRGYAPHVYRGYSSSAQGLIGAAPHTAPLDHSSGYPDPQSGMQTYLQVSVPLLRKNRFLLPADGQPNPLCFDVPLPHRLRLLQDSVSGFSMNGESVASNSGFRQIIIRYKTNHHLTINTNSISYYDGQNNVQYVWGQEPTQHHQEGVYLILRDNEIDVTMGNIRAVIVLHKKIGDVFLWPAVWQQPKGVSLSGILGKASISYQKIQGSNSPTLKIMGQRVKAFGADVTDYRFPSAPVVRCWLVPFQTVMNGDISDFTVTHL